MMVYPCTGWNDAGIGAVFPLLQTEVGADCPLSASSLYGVRARATRSALEYGAGR